MSDALDTEGAVEKLSKEAGILLIMLLAGGVALWFGWDQISAIFESQQKLERAVEEVAEQQTEIKIHADRLSLLEQNKMRVEVDLRRCNSEYATELHGEASGGTRIAFNHSRV
jgi:ABC-type siderophore export system fused ATPase/permease subunit